MAGGVTPDAVFAVVDDVMSRPFEWGPCDCCSAACDVFARLWGVDPMASIRGYRGHMAAARLMRRARGLEALAEDLARRAGLRAGQAVGGLALSVAHPPALLVCIEPGLWAGKTGTGFALLRQADRGWHLA